MKGKQESVKLSNSVEPVNYAPPDKKGQRKMGILSLMNFGKETVKKVCEISYSYNTAIVWKIDDVGKGLKKLGEYMADDESRAKMVYFSAKFVKNATLYTFKEAANILILGGRAFAKILSETVREIEFESRNNSTGSVVAEMLKSREVKLGSDQSRVCEVDSFAHQTPEDVLRFFMMMEFMGTRYLDDLLVSDHGRRKM